MSSKITSNPSKTQINCPDEITFRAVQSFLETNRDTVELFSFPLPDERYLKVAIKDVPLYITDDELSSELKNLGFQPQLIRAFQKKMVKEFPFTKKKK